MSLYVSFDQLMLLHQILYGRQVFPGVFAGEEAFNFAQPEIEIFHCRYISALLVGFF